VSETTYPGGPPAGTSTGVPRLLGSPLEVGGVVLRNRIVSPPIERNYCALDGSVTERYIAYLRARAAGGAALLFTEATYVRADGRGRLREMGAHDDHVIPGLRVLAGAVHAEGALLGVELVHAGRVAQTFVSGFQPVAPSPVPCEISGGEMPRELATQEIGEIVRSFADAARRCVEAGVDVISIHGAHGYLIHQFLSPRTNLRTDEYADPVRFLNEVLVAVRDAAPETPLFLRLSAFEGVEDGLDADATRALADRMRLDLVDVIDISAGSYEAGEWIVQPGEMPRGVLAPYAARYRDLGKIVSVAGRIATGEAAEAILQASDADLVCVGRALHADPAWSRKVLAGEPPRPCIACNQGCIDYHPTHQPIWCLANPDTGREWVPAPPPPAARRRVLVIGAGPAGLEAARTAAERGHEVLLVEEQAQIGGQYRLSARLPTRAEFGRLLDWYGAELERLKVDVSLSTRADVALVERIGPDAVVIATGSVGATPDIPGIDLPRVADLREWLAQWLDRSPAVPDEETVTVWGADRVGVAAADVLAARGARVLLLGAQPELAPEAGRREKILVVPRLRANPRVRIELGATLEAVEPDRLLVGRVGAREWHEVSGPVLVSQGTVPVRPSLGQGDWKTYVIGEASLGTVHVPTVVAGGPIPAGSADAAIREGAAAGQDIG
jgi:2,4-dienoyl-CoA reductase-like NADH-dependent reductase (Old Yellow Enzyme family)/thioredoxin reductase